MGLGTNTNARHHYELGRSWSRAVARRSEQYCVHSFVKQKKSQHWLMVLTSSSYSCSLLNVFSFKAELLWPSTSSGDIRRLKRGWNVDTKLCFNQMLLKYCCAVGFSTPAAKFWHPWVWDLTFISMVPCGSIIGCDMNRHFC